MQPSNARSSYTTFSNPQIGSVYQRPLALPLPFPAKAGMDITDLLGNKKRAAPVHDELRRYHASLQMTSGSGYAMHAAPTFGSNWPLPMQQSNGLQYPTMASSQHSPPSYGTPGYITRHDSQSTFADENFGSTQPRPKHPAKPFPCSFADCSKAFARRSDLSRHERIHTGVRPHQCDWQDCGRSFIQRSALTVHIRVHTGEKPHVCNYCSKAFSDSSSLARHRRIHSGTRPYKCEYANCQKTFTRRTTLTRHQNHHVGTTLEQAAAEVSAVLAAARPHNAHRYSSDSSPAGDSHQPSPVTERPQSGSPYAELPPMAAGMQRQHSNGYPSQHLALPAHLRADFQQSSAHPTSPLNGHTLHNFTSAPQQQRPVTSYPTSYGPPQPLEPPANGTASGGVSPHLVPWASPGPGTLPPPFPIDSPAYPEHGFAGNQLGAQQLGNHQLGGHHLYYHSAHGVQRPQSTEPRDYQSHMPSQVSLSHDWPQAPLDPQDSRQGAYGMWRRELPDRSQDELNGH